MKTSDWYAGRRRIVASQNALKTVMEWLENGFLASTWPVDPVTNQQPISFVTSELLTDDGKAFGIRSVTGGKVTLVLSSRATAIKIVPPIDVSELKDVSAITGSFDGQGTQGPVLRVLTATGDQDENQISAEAFFEAVEHAVLVEEPDRGWAPSP